MYIIGGIVFEPSDAFEKCCEVVEKNLEEISLCIVTTACPKKEKSSWVQERVEKYRQLGITKIEFLDFEFENGERLLAYDVVIIEKGSYIVLVEHAKKQNVRPILEKFKTGKRVLITTGISSGLMEKSIYPWCSVVSSYNKVQYESGHCKGLQFTMDKFMPHFSNYTSEDREFEELVSMAERNFNVKYTRNNDKEAIIITKAGRKVIGGEVRC